jgi:F0F1-type ATP synthase assembly protein I
MALPALFGYGLDSWLGTRVLFVAIGAILGLVVGMMHLVRLANAKTGGKRK